MKRRDIILFFLLSLAFSLGCNGSSPTQVEEGVELTIITDKNSYKPGETVKLTLRVVNTEEEKKIITLPTSCQYDFVVFRGGDEVFRLSRHQACLQVITQLILSPGEVMEFSYNWDQYDDSGVPVSPGEYEVRGEIPTSKPLLSGTKKIKIEGGEN
ncbi:MAG: hypothetical protein J7L64_08730 [Acidobacteria bacterium]|nr:hypothetical protein [Acidobacteriota bacterium]